MSQDPLFPHKIRYEYAVDPQSRLQLTHGVWGGINPQGEIEMNFYLESDKLPAFSERLVAPDGTLGHEILPADDDLRVITRHVHSKIVFNYHTARAMMEWLEEKIDLLETEEGSNPLLYEGDSSLEQ
ncbi:MAG: hypothetical protein RRY29_05535 [Desulfovibrionaceae bacterium]